METTLKGKQSMAKNVTAVADFIGRLFSFNSSLKLHHWHVTGKASYAQHIALDQAIEDLSDATDRLVETSYAIKGDLEVVIPETKNPTNIVKHAEDFFNYTESKRELFAEKLSNNYCID